MLPRNRKCCCTTTPLPTCTYQDNFEVKRDWLIDPLYASGSKYMGQPPSSDYNGWDGDAGLSGWYVSPYQVELQYVGCLEDCNGDEVGGTLDPPRPGWSPIIETRGDRMYLQANLNMDGHAEDGCVVGGCVIPRGYCGGSWGDEDKGTVIKYFVPDNTGAPNVTAQIFTYGDPTYRQDLDNCTFPIGGYDKWGLHFGDFATSSADDLLTSTTATNRIRVYMERFSPTVSYGKVAIWDKDSNLTTATLGTSYTASVAAAIPIEVNITSSGGGAFTITASIGGISQVFSGVELEGEFYNGSVTSSIPIGLFATAGGCWSSLCIDGVAAVSNCSSCLTPDFKDSWEILTTLGSGFDTGEISGGGCSPINQCNPGNPWAGLVQLGPDGSCSWRSCDDILACGDPCVSEGDSPAMRIFISDDPMIVLEYYAYSFSSGGKATHTLARYEAATTEICGPITFEKVSDDTDGSYFPATVTALKVYSEYGCSYGTFSEQPCCEDLFDKVGNFPEWEITPVIDPSYTVDVNYTHADLSSEWGNYGSIGQSVIMDGTVLIQVSMDTSGGPMIVCERTISIFAQCRTIYNESGEPTGTAWMIYVVDAAVPGTQAISATVVCDPFEISWSYSVMDCGMSLQLNFEITE